LIGAVALAADAAGADISLDVHAPHTDHDPRPGQARPADNAPHADNARTDPPGQMAPSTAPR
jgi:hypothetical protein